MSSNPLFLGLFLQGPEVAVSLDEGAKFSENKYHISRLLDSGQGSSLRRAHFKTTLSNICDAAL